MCDPPASRCPSLPLNETLNRPSTAAIPSMLSRKGDGLLPSRALSLSLVCHAVYVFPLRHTSAATGLRLTGPENPYNSHSRSFLGNGEIPNLVCIPAAVTLYRSVRVWAHVFTSVFRYEGVSCACVIYGHENVQELFYVHHSKQPHAFVYPAISWFLFISHFGVYTHSLCMSV